MNLDEFKHWFERHGMPFSWRLDKGPDDVLRDAVLLRDDPVDMAGLPLVVVLPDLHLGNGNDVFADDSPRHAKRLESFLGLLVALRAELGDFPVVQIGDLYDFYRVTPGASFRTGCNEIEHHYAGIMHKASQLGMLVSIGNHDAEFLKNPSYLTEMGLQGAAVHVLAGAVFYHGLTVKPGPDHGIEADPEAEFWLRIVDTAATVPLLGPVVNDLQRLFDHSCADPLPLSSTSLPWPPWKGDNPEEWDAPWVQRDGADSIAKAACDFAAEAGLQPPSIAFVGHQHRPGISCGRRHDGKWIPVVDVGSWTYGGLSLV